MTERNWAEHDRKIENNPSIKEAYGTGYTHAAYGWSRTPYGNWSEEHKEAYNDGYKDRMSNLPKKEKTS